MGDIGITISHTHLIYMYFASGAEIIYIKLNSSRDVPTRDTNILNKYVKFNTEIVQKYIY